MIWIILGTILSSTLLVISLICLGLLKAAARADRANERARNAWAAERGELVDKVLAVKGYREYLPVREEPKQTLEVEPSDDTPEGFVPWT